MAGVSIGIATGKVVEDGIGVGFKRSATFQTALQQQQQQQQRHVGHAGLPVKSTRGCCRGNHAVMAGDTWRSHEHIHGGRRICNVLLGRELGSQQQRLPLGPRVVRLTWKMTRKGHPVRLSGPGERDGRDRVGLPLTATADSSVSSERPVAVANDDEKLDDQGVPSASNEGTEAKTGSSKMSNNAPNEEKAESWKKVREMMEKGTICEVKVVESNSGGLVVHVAGLRGFLPFSQVDRARMTTDMGVTGGETMKMSAVGAKLSGKTISARVIEASERTSRLIVSEKAVIWAAQFDQLSVGDELAGVVTSVTDFGAFVDVKPPNGGSPMSGLIHVSEMSWDAVRNPADIVREGDQVSVKLIEIDRRDSRHTVYDIDGVLARRTRIRAVRLINVEEGHLFTFVVQSQLDDAGSDGVNDSDGAALPGLQEICDELLREEGVEKVLLGRKAIEKKVVSQDLELWLSNVPIEGGFTLLARSGRQVQEVNVITSLDREKMKAAVQTVTSRVP
ncbi:hypothetical protein CBR_g66800 [Chara braunii]|uniref:S1 motif domain-containing protein n=1 Tax=Chara braunii TaxID=69332 RepID=A0A388K9D9_CHABU|nr:hypothetical protein CBR_g66800 [Chara braunii]|eukprot:GBG66665.1 hypothetical protein CBR_g66800 [Chara braunii]